MFQSLKKGSVSDRMSKEYELSRFLEGLQLYETYCYTYILQLADSTYYTGITSKPIDRYTAHQAGKSKSTKFKRPLKLVCLVKCDSRKQARALEVRIKNNGAKRVLIRFQSLVLMNDQDLLYYRWQHISLDRRKEYQALWNGKERIQDNK